MRHTRESELGLRDSAVLPLTSQGESRVITKMHEWRLESQTNQINPLKTVWSCSYQAGKTQNAVKEGVTSLQIARFNSESHWRKFRIIPSTSAELLWSSRDTTSEVSYGIWLWVRTSASWSYHKPIDFPEPWWSTQVKDLPPKHYHLLLAQQVGKQLASQSV